MSEVIPACLLRLQHSVQALALPADEQLSLFPDFVCKVDELALDFDHLYRCVRPYKEEFTELQISLLDKIDNEVDEMSGAVNAIFWTEAALREDLFWRQVRILAKETLTAFQWTEEISPSYEHEYIKGHKRGAHLPDTEGKIHD